ncbi:MAG TPA: hypothetical protein VG672_06815 [Bryobacteraceae bacterium]|nr:hypothetical protein [Bryobacteraceae bacterium]
MTPAGEKLRARIISECEREIRIYLAGPLAERKKRAEMAAARTDAAGWSRHYDPMTPVAVHESGHLLVCALMGQPFQRVSIRPLPNSGGRLMRGDQPVAPDADAVPGSSDRKLIVGRLHWLWLAYDSPDWKGMRAILRRLRGETDELLTRHWHYVEAVANRLLVRLELDGVEAAGLLAGLRPHCHTNNSRVLPGEKLPRVERPHGFATVRDENRLPVVGGGARWPR